MTARSSQYVIITGIQYGIVPKTRDPHLINSQPASTPGVNA